MQTSSAALTDVDPSVLDVLGDTLDDHAPPLDTLLVEVPDQLVPVAVDTGRPQRARVHALPAPNLRRNQT